MELTVLEADERYPDGCFVEDTAVVNSKVAVITHPGADARRGEEAEISRALSGYRALETIEFPGTLEGGDILRAENHYYIGLSGRTNSEGARQLSAILSKYEIHFIGNYGRSRPPPEIGHCVPRQRKLISTPAFSKMVFPANTVILDQDESYSANCLQVNDFLLIPRGFPKSKAKIEALGYNIIRIRDVGIQEDYSFLNLTFVTSLIQLPTL